MKRLPRIPLLLLLGALLSSLAFAGDPSKDLQKKALKAVLKGDFDAAAEFVQQIGEVDSEDAAEALVEIVVKIDQVPDLDSNQAVAVYDACTEALASISDPDARQYVYEQIASRKADWRVKIVFVEVCSRYNDESSTQALIEALTSKKQHEKVQLSICRAFGDMRCVAAVPALIDLIEELDKRKGDVWVEAKLALTEITGEDLETPEDWRNYWAVRGENFNPETDRGASDEAGTVLRNAPDIFGTEVLSKQIVVIIDISGSMHRKEPLSRKELEGTAADDVPDQDNSKGPCDECGESHKGVNLGDERMRINRAKAELTRLIESLGDDVQFNIIKYNHDITPWKDSLQQANDKNKVAAIKYVRDMYHEGLTLTGEALEKAFEISEEANTFYLISDGVPTGDDGNPLPAAELEEIHRTVQDLNKFRKVRIHTIGFQGASKPFMEKLAADNDGEFHTVD